MQQDIAQVSLFTESDPATARPLKGQFLKWIGNKQRFAGEIIEQFPVQYERYIEPFLGSGAVLAALSPQSGVGADTFEPLIEIWTALKSSPDTVKDWYASRWDRWAAGDARDEYERIKASYNSSPNGRDLLFLCRACYGGVVRFRKADGYMSTPVGVHKPIAPKAFNARVDDWNSRIQGTRFYCQDYLTTLSKAGAGDVVYCDPPYSHSQAILYGAQAFDLHTLVEAISDAKSRGAFIALSIDGTKKSGNVLCDVPLKKDLFERELSIDCGRSMLKRFQMSGRTLDAEEVSDRLLLTA